MRVLRDAAAARSRRTASVRDITERMAAKTALEEAEARFRSTFERGADRHGDHRRPTGASCASTARSGDMLGLRAAASSRARTSTTVTHPDDRALDADGDAPRCSPARRDSYRVEKRYLHANGDAVWADAVEHARARRDDGDAAVLPQPDAGHHRAPALRGRAAPPRRPRPAHRAAQPALVRARARAPRRARSSATARAARRWCSTSTTSRRSTTRSATAPATS